LRVVTCHQSVRVIFPGRQFGTHTPPGAAHWSVLMALSAGAAAAPVVPKSKSIPAPPGEVEDAGAEPLVGVKPKPRSIPAPVAEGAAPEVESPNPAIMSIPNAGPTHRAAPPPHTVA